MPAKYWDHLKPRNLVRK